MLGLRLSIGPRPFACSLAKTAISIDITNAIRQPRLTTQGRCVKRARHRKRKSPARCKMPRQLQPTLGTGWSSPRKHLRQAFKEPLRPSRLCAVIRSGDKLLQGFPVTTGFIPQRHGDFLQSSFSRGKTQRKEVYQIRVAIIPDNR